MASYRIVAQLYFALVLIIACVTFLATFTMNVIPDYNLSTVLILAFGALFLIAEIAERRIQSGKYIITVAASAIIFLSIVAGQVGLAIVAVGTLIVDMYYRRPWHAILFNVAIRTVIFTALSWLYIVQPMSESVTLVIMAVVYYVLNFALMNVMIALTEPRTAMLVIRKSLPHSALVHAITLPCGISMALLWQDSQLYALLPFVAVLALTQLILVTNRDHERVIEHLSTHLKRIASAKFLDSLVAYCTTFPSTQSSRELFRAPAEKTASTLLAPQHTEDLYSKNSQYDATDPHHS